MNKDCVYSYKVASQDSLLNMVKDSDAKDIKKTLISTLEDETITNVEYDFLLYMLNKLHFSHKVTEGNK